MQINIFLSTSYRSTMAALKKVEKFCWVGDVERWLDRIDFAMLVDDVNSDKKAQYLAACLDGAAYDAWKGMRKEVQFNLEIQNCCAIGLAFSRMISNISKSLLL